MIVYLDACAPVKRNAAETGTPEVAARIRNSEALGTTVLSRAEVAAALAGIEGLRGYDAVHLASALFWYESLNEPVTLATYDRELWRGAKASGLVPWPPAMP